MLRVSLSPCCRSHPAGVDRRGSQTATTHVAFAFTVAGSASGAPHFRGHLCVRWRYGLETRPHPADGAVERLQKVGFPSPCSPSYRALAFPLVGFPPTEHASLRWTHNRVYQSPGTRLQQSTHSKRCSGAVNLAMTVSVVYQLSWSPSLYCANSKGNYIAIFGIAICQPLSSKLRSLNLSEVSCKQVVIEVLSGLH